MQTASSTPRKLNAQATEQAITPLCWDNETPNNKKEDAQIFHL
jgi:hypothetical protein